MRTIDINVDVAEGFAFDEELLEIATSANVCCGSHAGNVALTFSTIETCKTLGVRVGAHPGVGDRKSMGRSPMTLETSQQVQSLADDLSRQIDIAEWSYIKPHGWLYNASVQPGWAAQAVQSLLERTRLPLLGLPRTNHAEIAEKCNVRFIKEGFADRRYHENGHLVPRLQPNAVLSDEHEIVEQVLRLAETVDSICVHGDTPNCVEIARLVKATLEKNGYKVSTWR